MVDRITSPIGANDLILKTNEVIGSLSSKASVNIDDLSYDGNNRLHALKGYKDEGELLTDSEGLADVNYYAHSTFDADKFTVVGSPTITDDGIASGFSPSNYLILQNMSLGNSTWELYFQFNTSTIDQTYGVLSFSSGFTLGVALTTTGLLVSLGTGTLETFDIGQIRIPITTNTNYFVKISFNGTKYDCGFLENGEFVSKGTLNSTTKIPSNLGTMRIGLHRTGTTLSMQGSIDLKQFSITVDGVEVFSGNKTGIDTIKPTDFTATVSGSSPYVNPSLPFSQSGLTITEDGIVNGNSTANSYIKTTTITTLTNDTEIYCKFELNRLGASQGLFGASLPNNPIDNYLCVFISASNNVVFRIPNSDGSYYYGASYTPSATDKILYAKVIIKGTTGTGYISSDGKNWTQVTTGTTSSTFSNFGINILKISAASGVDTCGSNIDLNEFKVYVDGDLVYQPCLKIPYTESKTGSKIVDSIYRERVTDMYDQFGYAPYFILDEDNKNYELPRGEVYGLMVKQQPTKTSQLINDSGYQANVIETVKVNGTALIPSSRAVNITVPTNTTQLINGSGYITGITSSMVTIALGYTPYNSTNPSGYQANVIETVKVNGTVLTPSSKAVDIAVPTSTTQLTNDSGFITGITSSMVTGALGFTPENHANLTTVVTNSSTDSQYPSAKAVYSISNANTTAIAANTTAIAAVTTLIPTQATSSNQLADKNFVNSSVQTATANFRGNWDTWSDVPTAATSYPEDYAGSKTPTVNDYLVVQDASGYTGDTLSGTWRFKYSGTWSTNGKAGWLPEYQVNETPLTSAQLAALNSGITATSKVTRSGTVAVGNTTKPVYVDANGVVQTCSVIPTSTTQLTNDSGYITGITSTMVTTALGYTPYNSSNPSGYITSSSLSSYQLIAQPVTSLAASGTISLSDNTINKITATGTVTFSLPTISDLTKFHQILVQLNMSTVQTINLGTAYYFDSMAPDMSTAGTYNLVYEYDNTASHWVVGCLSKGSAS